MSSTISNPSVETMSTFSTEFSQPSLISLMTFPPNDPGSASGHQLTGIELSRAVFRNFASIIISSKASDIIIITRRWDVANSLA